MHANLESVFKASNSYTWNKDKKNWNKKEFIFLYESCEWSIT